ncbi:MAG TPA: ABC transporter ATP-binding protein [Gaiellaceae bacterium]|nr:ABC transporter ATP-binding protein [Gaiellaceae bacterium]
MSVATVASMPPTPLLEVEHLKLYFPVKSGVVLDRVAGWVRAVDDVSFEIHEQETLGLVGESGCGKTTLARCLVQLLDPTEGAIRFRGEAVGARGRAGRRALRRELQIVFQDPQASLNPRKRIGQIVSAGLRLRGLKGRAAADELRRLLGDVGLGVEYVNRFPHEFSGGQRQRVGVARALAVRPSLIVLDEPVSALDVSVQSQVINLLSDLQDEFRLGYIFVAHDLSVVRHVSDRIAVMYLGKIVELSPGDELYRRPIHPYTAALLDAIPVPDLARRGTRAAPVRGEPPNPLDPPAGCRFHPRCPRATDVCRAVEPQLTAYPSGHLAACHHPLNVNGGELAAATRSQLSPLTSGSEAPTLVA